MNSVAQSIERAGVLAIVRSADTAAARADIDALLAAGVTTLEVSLVTPGALDLIAEFSERPGLTVGVGTVMSTVQVAAAAAAGARFVVSPSLDEEVIAATLAAGMASFPGAGTVSEFVRATALGAHGVKVFPATVFGPAGVRATLAALPHLRLVPTGGVSLDQVDDYLAAGARAVGMGSELVRAARSDATALSDRLACWNQRPRSVR